MATHPPNSMDGKCTAKTERIQAFISIAIAQFFASPSLASPSLPFRLFFSIFNRLLNAKSARYLPSTNEAVTDLDSQNK